MGTPRSRPNMTRWYYPMALAWTAYRVLSITNVTGMFDLRELMAALDPFSKEDFGKHHDLSSKSDVWLDYVADTGEAGGQEPIRMPAEPEGRR